uniref:Uncharacterized protein n=1 Tax=Ascaris lumbricoides TaxID=6252 RepID=A0A0M3HFS4_ASCLU
MRKNSILPLFSSRRDLTRVIARKSDVRFRTHIRGPMFLMRFSWLYSQYL